MDTGRPIATSILRVCHYDTCLLATCTNATIILQSYFLETGSSSCVFDVAVESSFSLPDTTSDGPTCGKDVTRGYGLATVLSNTTLSPEMSDIICLLLLGLSQRFALLCDSCPAASPQLDSVHLRHFSSNRTRLLICSIFSGGNLVVPPNPVGVLPLLIRSVPKKCCVARATAMRPASLSVLNLDSMDSTL